MFPRPLCENPTLIFNRKAIYNLLTLGEYVLGGKTIYLTSQILEVYRQNFPIRYFNKLCHSFESYHKVDGKFVKVINWKGLENSYCGYDANHQKVYLFLAVPCGHCVLCTDKKQNDFIARCKMENQTSVTRPIMVTLTYSQPFLPFAKDFDAHFVSRSFNKPNILRFDTSSVLDTLEVSTTPIPLITRNVPYYKDIRLNKYVITDPTYDGFYPVLMKTDVQKFLKRLRIMWDRSSLTSPRPLFRYCCFGEYGHKYGRPHYHFIFWNVPYNITKPTCFQAIELLKRDILKAWGMCEYDACQCEVARDAAAYVSKYISKNFVDANNNRGFRLASNRYGGLGALFLRPRIPFLRKNPSVQSISYVDKWSGKFTQSTFGKYVHDRVFPSASKQIPDKYKQVLRYNDYILSTLGRLSLVFKQDKVAKRCEELSFEDNLFPSVIPSEFSYFVSVNPTFLTAPDFYFFIEMHDELCKLRDDMWKTIDGIVLPTEQSVLELSNLRYQHDNLFLRKEVTDELILVTKNSILRKREIALSKEKF